MPRRRSLDTVRTSSAEGAGSAELTRRTFLVASTAVGGGLLLSVGLPQLAVATAPKNTGEAHTLNAYIRIETDGVITIMVARAAARYEISSPATKEAYFYRRLFEEYFPDLSCAKTVPGGKSIACSTPAAIAWDVTFAASAVPVASARVTALGLAKQDSHRLACGSQRAQPSIAPGLRSS